MNASRWKDVVANARLSRLKQTVVVLHSCCAAVEGELACCLRHPGCCYNKF